MIREICINLSVICEPTTFLGDLSVIKACKGEGMYCTCLLDALADGGLRTKHSDSAVQESAGGPRM